MKKIIFGLALGAMSAGALAQPVFTIESVQTGINSTSADVTVSIDTDGITSQAGGINVVYDPTELTFDNTLAGNVAAGCAPVTPINQCFEQNAAGNITIAGFGALVDGTVATLTFGIVDASAPATFTLTQDLANPATLTDGAFNDIMATVVDGAVEIISGPSLAANNSPQAIMIPTNGSGMASLEFGASNGTVTNISCAASGDSEISFDTSGVPGMTDSTFSVPATCSSSAAGSFTSDLTCNYDGGMAVATVNCTAADGAPVVAVDPADGGTLIIGGLLPGGTGSRPVTFSETGGAGSGTAYSVTGCTISGTDFSLSSATVDVPFGGSASITVTASGPTSVVTETLSCTVNGAPYSASVTVGFRPLVVPTLQQWGMILMVLSLAAFGFVTLRRRGEI